MKRIVAISAVLLCLQVFHVQAQGVLWEEPEILKTNAGEFLEVVSNGDQAVMLWQDITERNSESGSIYLSLQSTRDGLAFNENRRFAGPYEYRGRPAKMYSAALNSGGLLYAAVLDGQNSFTLFGSTDQGSSFREYGEFTSENTITSIRLSFTANGRLLLFATMVRVENEEDESEVSLTTRVGTQYIAASYYDQDAGFQDLKDISGSGLEFSYLPFHVSHSGRDYCFFQAQAIDSVGSNNLFMVQSNNNGSTWNAPVNLTENLLIEGDGPEDNYVNQRPSALSWQNRLMLVWERSSGGSNSTVIISEVSTGGALQGQPRRVSDGPNSLFPRLAGYKDVLYCSYFEKPRASDGRIVIKEESGFTFLDSQFAGIAGDSSFPWPYKLNGKLFYAWENQRNDRTRIAHLTEDISVDTPALSAENFRAGGRDSKSRLIIRWQNPSDTSGIEGSSWVWTQNPGVEVDTDRVVSGVNDIILSAPEDGQWYFKIRTKDYAGNWSEPAVVTYFRDTTPPGRPRIIPPEVDENGFVVSNTFSLEWLPPDDPDVAGYAYTTSYAAPFYADPDTWNSVSLEVGRTVMTNDTGVTYNNHDNGVWVFGVRAIDTTGNASPVTELAFKLNKYKPVTYITSVSASTDRSGTINMEIRGRGFSAGGAVERVLLDRDGSAPWDYEYSLSSGAYTVNSDRRISSLEIQDIETGVYRVGVVHPTRGLYMKNHYVSLESGGTVKFGYYVYEPGQRNQSVMIQDERFNFSHGVVILLIMVLGLLTAFSFRRVYAYYQETVVLRKGIESLFTGKRITKAEYKRATYMKQKGLSLRFKFAASILLLVISVILMIAVPVGYYMITNQQQSLARNLEQKAELMLSGMITSAETYLQSQSIIDLENLIVQTEAMEEVNNSYILGQGTNDPDSKLYIWASTDEALDFFPGEELFNSELVPFLRQLREDKNTQAERVNGEKVNEYYRILREIDELIRTGGVNIDARVAALREEAETILQDIRSADYQIAKDLKSFPEYRISNFSSEDPLYYFYVPLVNSTIRDAEPYRGAIVIQVSIETILAEISEAQTTLIRIILIISLIVVVIGFAGSFFLASITVNPIKRVVKGLEKIRDTEDKSQLKGHIITVKSKDELSLLADTVNQMTMGLVKAAEAAKDLTVGKEVQKMFIPLEKKRSGEYATTGSEENDDIEFFGYYEGAKGVSGDYFYYMRLDDEYYTVIKCDVAGKGVPAALIMVEVASIYLNYFKDWTYKNKGIKLDKLVSRTNDLLEERKFQGRFAALNVGIINIKTGKSWFCNAGDNLMIMWDESRGTVIQKELPEAPAAGVFPSMLVEMKNGFKQEPIKLDRGDIIFLATDGLEEAKRFYRDSNYNRITKKIPSANENEPDEEIDGEEFTLERFKAIIDAVFSMGTFKLELELAPNPEEEMVFNFNECEGKLDEAVMAIISVEKIFRMVPDPNAGAEDRIMIDPVVDDFLQKHFVQYRKYFNNPVDVSENPDYRFYTHLKEDEQYDDLTIVAIKKK